MKITRRFTSADTNVFDSIKWEKRTSRISDADGSVVFEMNDAEIPADWSQLATDIMVSKYFRKAGVPQKNEDGTPKLDADTGKVITGPERSVKDVINRLAGCWRHWGEKNGYFDTPEDAQAFYDELSYMMLRQMCAPNSPQWFNTGLNWAYGINGPAQGHWIAEPKTGEVKLSPDAYGHPQPHACFIQSIDDDLVNEGGIMDLWVREARLFKYGSGTGTNFSSLRGENESLSGGGKSSGLMSWLRIGDRAAGAIKSGGTTRRAAKMVCLDADHPDIEQFISWKLREELKVAAMVEGMKHLPQEQKDLAESLGLKLTYDFNGEAYYTVSGQNSNNSVRLTDAFFEALEVDGDWELINRTDGKVAKTLKARDLWKQICKAAWGCADPGLQYDSTINAWHTCPAGGNIEASNPCVTGDTLIATSTGYRRIEDLVGKSAEIINGNGDCAWVDRIFKTGHKPVYELKTRSGYRISLTSDHRVFTLNRGDVPACELTVDDIVSLGQPGFGDEFIPEAFGELVGAAVGDGCITQNHNQEFLFITLGANESVLANRMQQNISECKLWLDKGDGRTIRETNITTTQTGLRIGTSVQAVLCKLREYARLDAGSSKKRFNDTIFSLDKPSQSAILRGLFTTDGTVANYGSKSQYVSLDSTSLELLQQVQLLLLGFGIKAKIYENRRAIDQTTAMLPDGKGGMKKYEVQQMHSLRISRSSRVVFETEIGFVVDTAKAKALTELNQSVNTYEDKLIDHVLSLTLRGEEDVFDLTEPISNHFVAGGLVIHNCSEYMFLNNTACNLASINLIKFYDSDARKFDIDGYEHAIRLWTIVLEISVLMASFPSKEIALESYRYRTLGLGYANLGAMLMQAGIAYDSEEARAVCGTLTSILTGRSYATSSEMAKELGAFASFNENREAMLRVIRNHRRAAYGVPRDAEAYEDLKIRPVPIDHRLYRTGGVNIANADELLGRATTAWDNALELGEQYGYRNAQTTVIAPTGTIGLLMDCDTTGVEPDFALVKFKKLSGGGYFKIANASLRPALKALGYDQKQMDEILTHVMGTLSIDTPMGKGKGTLREFLVEHGYTSQELVELENQLPTAFELSFAFNAWSMPEHVLESLGADIEKSRASSSFNGLKLLGLSKSEIESLNLAVCGTQTIEGAPHIKDEHLSVFDCANRCGELGTRFIATQGHIRMMAAAQPFISGAISKTINLPNEASVEDISDSYRLSWELGLKANALYRDGSKLSQPLNTKTDTENDDATEDEKHARTLESALGEASTAAAGVAEPAISTSSKSSESKEVIATPEPVMIERIVERIVERPLRRRLPDTRASITHRFNVAGHEGYLTVGLYKNGNPGELFITMSKEGSTIGGLMDCLGTAISVALQYGVPIDSLVKKFEHQRFEPMGMTTSSDIPFAKSLVDYIFRWMGMEFIAGYREANAPKRSRKTESKSTQQIAISSNSEKRALPSSRESLLDRSVSDESPADISGGGDAPVKEKVRIVDAIQVTEVVTTEKIVETVGEIGALYMANAAMMGDAPACDVCGMITVRNGTCYKCLNCGNSMGCS